jgi:hypothetical protein
VNESAREHGELLNLRLLFMQQTNQCLPSGGVPHAKTLAQEELVAYF